MANVEQIGTKIGQEYTPLYNELTTSDLQACISASVAKEGLTGNEAKRAEDVALDYIYALFGR